MSTRFSDRWVVGYQNFCSLSIKAIFLPQNMLSWAHIGLAGSFGALLVCWLVVVVRGLYLSRHLSTLCIIDNVHGITPKEINSEIMYRMC